jgi:segregation and condensation protein A
LDSIRCFFAVLFLARDEKVTLEQKDDDILVTLITDIPKKSEGDGKSRKSG